MKEMEEYALLFERLNRGRGQVTAVTSYSFVWETLPDLKHPDKPVKKTTYYKSYFLFDFY